MPFLFIYPAVDFVASFAPGTTVETPGGPRKRDDGMRQVLVPAIELTGLTGISVAEVADGVDYTHLTLERHEVIMANGGQIESFHPRPVAPTSPPGALHRELSAIFADLTVWRREAVAPRARPFAGRPEGRGLIRRHRKRVRPLFEMPRELHLLHEA